MRRLNYPYVAGVGFLFLFAYVLLIGTLGAWWPRLGLVQLLFFVL